jgi:hypothetical protein
LSSLSEADQKKEAEKILKVQLEVFPKTKEIWNKEKADLNSEELAAHVKKVGLKFIS